jgi:hypothetical protein
MVTEIDTVTEIKGTDEQLEKVKKGCDSNERVTRILDDKGREVITSIISTIISITLYELCIVVIVKSLSCPAL